MKSVLRYAVAALALGACSSAPVTDKHFSSEAELDQVRAVLQRDFHARGSAGLDRLQPDAVQRACNLHDNVLPEALARKLEAEQFAAIPFPAGNLVGDWKRGQRIAQSGRGLQWNDGPKDVAGGSCYNCHQLSPQETSHGTLGPSLLGFGKLRGNSPEMQKYAYGRIYNSKAYNACSQMPRLGHSRTLTEEQIKDLVGYLLDPASPVNK
jgi:L-cysteine S-thiosulfotransferase